MNKPKNKGFAEISVSYKSKKKFDKMPFIRNSTEAQRLFRKIWSDKIEHVEEVYVLLLNHSKRALGYSKVSMGGFSVALTDRRVIFQIALKGNASSIIIAHNHPSGNLRPSEQDLKLSQYIKRAGEIMDIPLIDHLIMTKDGFKSLADEGKLQTGYDKI